MVRLGQISWRYFFWHYNESWKDIRRITGNLIWFLANFFSIGLLWRTLFAPWKRMGERGAGNSKLENFLGKILINTLMRLVGLVFRLLTIVTGVATMIATLLLSLVFQIVWFFMPALVLFFFFFGLGQAFGLAN